MTENQSLLMHISFLSHIRNSLWEVQVRTLLSVRRANRRMTRRILLLQVSSEGTLQERMQGRIASGGKGEDRHSGAGEGQSSSSRRSHCRLQVWYGVVIQGVWLFWSRLHLRGYVGNRRRLAGYKVTSLA